MTCAGLPHSEIPGSKLICSSPRLIAAYHVLHRLLVPRHPPYALCSLTEKSSPVLRTLALRQPEGAQRPGVTTGSHRQIFGVNLYSIFKEPGPSAGANRPARNALGFPEMVGLGGVEPPTSRLSGVRSNRLSYSPLDNRITRAECEPAGLTWEMGVALRRRLSP